MPYEFMAKSENKSKSDGKILPLPPGFVAKQKRVIKNIRNFSGKCSPETSSYGFLKYWGNYGLIVGIH